MSKNIVTYLFKLTALSVIIIVSYLILVPQASYQYEPVGENITIQIDETWNGFTYHGFNWLDYGILEYTNATPFHVDNLDLITIESQATYMILAYTPDYCVITEVERTQ